MSQSQAGNSGEDLARKTDPEDNETATPDANPSAAAATSQPKLKRRNTADMSQSQSGNPDEDAARKSDPEDDETATLDAKPPAATGTAQLKWKRRNKIKAKKPRDHPRRPLSAYNIFFQEQRQIVLREREGKVDDPNSDLFSTMAKIISKRWKELPPKNLERFQKLAQEDLARYRREMEQYQLKLAKRNAEMTASFKLEQQQNKGACHGTASQSPSPPEGAALHNPEDQAFAASSAREEAPAAQSTFSSSASNPSYYFQGLQSPGTATYPAPAQDDTQESARSEHGVTNFLTERGRLRDDSFLEPVARFHQPESRLPAVPSSFSLPQSQQLLQLQHEASLENRLLGQLVESPIYLRRTVQQPTARDHQTPFLALQNSHLLLSNNPSIQICFQSNFPIQPTQGQYRGIEGLDGRLGASSFGAFSGYQQHQQLQRLQRSSPPEPNLAFLVARQQEDEHHIQLVMHRQRQLQQQQELLQLQQLQQQLREDPSASPSGSNERQLYQWLRQFGGP